MRDATSLEGLFFRMVSKPGCERSKGDHKKKRRGEARASNVH